MAIFANNNERRYLLKRQASVITTREIIKVRREDVKKKTSNDRIERVTFNETTILSDQNNGKLKLLFTVKSIVYRLTISRCFEKLIFPHDLAGSIVPELLRSIYSTSRGNETAYSLSKKAICLSEALHSSGRSSPGNYYTWALRRSRSNGRYRREKFRKRSTMHGRRVFTLHASYVSRYTARVSISI